LTFRGDQVMRVRWRGAAAQGKTAARPPTSTRDILEEPFSNSRSNTKEVHPVLGESNEQMGVNCRSPR